MNAVLTAPAPSEARAGAMPAKPLWGDIEIPVIVGTGEHWSGKTIFGLSICPGPQTICYDQEASSLTYRSLGFEHVDMAAELLKKYPDGFTPEQRFLWWREHAMARGKTGKYRVLMVDPASELENGLADHIKKNLSKFDLTLDQIKKGGGIFWGVMKDTWKLTLDMLRPYYECIYLTVHLRDGFADGRPTFKREAKGKDTLEELASLYLWFTRDKDQEVPSAEIKKHRLSKFTWVDGELVTTTIFPPRLPKATPKAIREYILKPADYSKLKKDEKSRDGEVSEEEKMLMQARIAEANREATANELSKLQLMQQNAARQAAMLEQTGAAVKTTRPPISEHQISTIINLLTELFGGPQAPASGEFLAPRCQAAGVQKVTQFTDAQADGLLSDLLKIKSDRQREQLEARGKELLATSAIGSSPADPPFIPSTPPASELQELSKFIGESLPTSAPQPQVTPTPPAQPSPEVTAVMRAEFERLVPLAFPNEATRGAKVPALILKHGAPRAGLLTPNQFNALLAEMQEIADANSAPRVRPETMSTLKDICEKIGWPREKQQQWLTAHGYALFHEASDREVLELIEEKRSETAGFDSRNGGMPGNS